MLLDVFGFFKKTGLDIRTAISEAYPDNKLENARAARSLFQIGGSIAALKACLENRIEQEEKEKEDGTKFRSLDSEWQPSDETKPQQERPTYKNMPINYFSVLDQFVTTTENSISFYKKTGDSTAHGQLQKLSGAVDMLIAFLDSIKVSPNEKPLVRDRVRSK